CCCLGGEGVAPWPCRAPVAHGLVAVSWWPLWSGVHRFFRLARAAARGAAVGDGADRRADGELTRARRGRPLGPPCTCDVRRGCGRARLGGIWAHLAAAP